MYIFSIGKNYKYFKKIFYLCEEYFSCMYVCMYAMCIPGACWSYKRVRCPGTGVSWGSELGWALEPSPAPIKKRGETLMWQQYFQYQPQVLASNLFRSWLLNFRFLFAEKTFVLGFMLWVLTLRNLSKDLETVSIFLSLYTVLPRVVVILFTPWEKRFLAKGWKYNCSYSRSDQCHQVLRLWLVP